MEMGTLEGVVGFVEAGIGIAAMQTASPFVNDFFHHCREIRDR